MSSRRSMNPHAGARSSGRRYGLSTSAMTSLRRSWLNWADSSSNERAGACMLDTDANSMGVPQEVRGGPARLVAEQ